MDPVSAIALTSAALSLVEQLLPVVDGFQKNGQISAEAQAELRAKFESLKTKADAQFSDPAWKVN